MLEVVGRLGHELGGLLGLRRLKKLDDGLAERDGLEALGQGLAELAAIINAGPRRLLLVGEQQHRDEILAGIDQAWAGIGNTAATPAPFAPDAGIGQVREAWAANTQVSFCAKAYPGVPVGHPDAPVLSVLSGFLRNGFLHTAVREQGGAYGGGASYDGETGAFRFYSYRDPRLSGTLEDFDRAIGWLASTDHEYRAL